MNNVTTNENNLVIDYDKLIKAIIAKKECDKVINYIRPTLDNLNDSLLKEVFA